MKEYSYEDVLYMINFLNYKIVNAGEPVFF